MRKIKLGIVALVACASMSLHAQDKSAPYLDINRPAAERVADLLSRLTLDEKLSLLTATSPGIPRLGIDKYYHGNECLHGVVRPGSHTVFPQAIGLGAMWNPALMHTIATAISDEARAQWNSLDFGRAQTSQFSDLLTFWSPTVNMARDPRWGRTPETYGEDPYLTGVLGEQFVKGLQGNHPRYLKVVSTPKHFAANNEENTRTHCNAIIPESQLREYYFPAFERCIREGHAAAIMAAYNGINDVPCHANPWLLKDVLRKEWKFDGYVVTDCGALEFMVSQHKFVKQPFTSAMLGIKSGIDLECGDSIYREPLLSALRRGMVSEAEIDSAASHVLRARMRLGIFDPVEANPYNLIPKEVIGCEKHTQLALEAARQCLVLLKNNRQFLPLDSKRIKRIGVLGVNTENCEFGDYSGTPVVRPVSILEGIRKRVGADAEVLYAPWVNLPQGYEMLGASAFTGDGITETYIVPGKEQARPDARRVENIYYQPKLQAPNALAPTEYPYTVRWTGDIVAPQSGQFTFRFKADSHCSLAIDGKEVIVEGKTDSCVVTLEAGRQYAIAAQYQAATEGAECQLYWHTPVTHQKIGIDRFGKAGEVLRNSDVAVLVLGTNMSIEREGLDRDAIELPAMQRKFVEEAYKINPNIVVVLAAGGPLAIGWVDAHVPAVLNTWYGGQACGTVVAEALFGDYNPGGRLPLTYYASTADLPDFHDYDIRKGRTYQYFKGKPLYPFGYGLSYTTFKYGKPTLAEDADSLHVSFALTNTGKRMGDEVAQLYVRYDAEQGGTYPLRQLKAFSRVTLQKGERRRVTLSVARKDIRYWDDRQKAFVTPKGHYTLMVGSSSADDRFTIDYTNK